MVLLGRSSPIFLPGPRWGQRGPERSEATRRRRWCGRDRRDARLRSRGASSAAARQPAVRPRRRGHSGGHRCTAATGGQIRRVGGCTEVIRPRLRLHQEEQLDSDEYVYDSAPLGRRYGRQPCRATCARSPRRRGRTSRPPTGSGPGPDPPPARPWRARRRRARRRPGPRRWPVRAESRGRRPRRGAPVRARRRRWTGATTSWARRATMAASPAPSTGQVHRGFPV